MIERDSTDIASDQAPDGRLRRGAAARAVDTAGPGALSVQAGNPLSERRLVQMFGRTSRRWGLRPVRLRVVHESSMTQNHSLRMASCRPS